MTILNIPADNIGNKLFLKDYSFDGKNHFIFYKSTYNNIPFRKTIIYEQNDCFLITGDDGTVIFRFQKLWIDKFND